MVGPAASSGTTVRFKPDPVMFTETTVYDFDTLLTRLREESFLNAGVRITLTDERGEEVRRESMCYEGGIRSFVDYIHEKRQMTVLHPAPIYFKGQQKDIIAEVALQYNDSFNELMLSFANNVHTPDGGTHEEGFKAALTRIINDFGRKKGYLKEKDDNLSGADVREGLTAVISVKLTDAQFEGQTKAKLGNTEVRSLVSGLVYDSAGSGYENMNYLTMGPDGPVYSASRRGVGGGWISDVVDSRGQVLLSGLADVSRGDGLPDGVIAARRGFERGYMDLDGNWLYSESIFASLADEDSAYYW